MKQPLKLHEFFAKFANATINERLQKFTFDATSPIQNMNLFQIYESLEFLESEIRPRKMRQDEILEAVSEFL